MKSGEVFLGDNRLLIAVLTGLRTSTLRAFLTPVKRLRCYVVMARSLPPVKGALELGYGFRGMEMKI